MFVNSVRYILDLKISVSFDVRTSVGWWFHKRKVLGKNEWMCESTFENFLKYVGASSAYLVCLVLSLNIQSGCQLN